mgnify:CR=1 FL=1
MSRPAIYREDSGSRAPAGRPPGLGLRFDRLDRVSLLAAATLLVISLGAGLRRSPAQKPGEPREEILEILRLREKQEMPAAEQGPSRELRFPVVASGPQGDLERQILILRGNWGFGVARPDSLEMSLGKPDARGPAYLAYHLAGGQVQLVLLFSAGRLDTLVLSPRRPEAWLLPVSEARACFSLPAAAAPAGGLWEVVHDLVYYQVGQSTVRLRQCTIRAIYTQGLTRDVVNPVWVHGLEAPAGKRDVPAAEEPVDLAQHYRQALGLKERALGKNHRSVLFLQLELGRAQQDGGDTTAGARTMRDALAALKSVLGPDHPDILAWEVPTGSPN